MLIHDLGWGAPEWRPAGYHLPESHAKRIQIRANVDAHSRKLLGAGKFRRSRKRSWHRNRGLRGRFGDRFRQTQVDNLRCYAVSLLQTHHDIGRFNISVDQLLLMDRRQPRSNLGRNFQCQLYLEAARALNKTLQSFSFDEFHGIEVVLTSSAEVED